MKAYLDWSFTAFLWPLSQVEMTKLLTLRVEETAVAAARWVWKVIPEAISS
jgi:hypothetical protein